MIGRILARKREAAAAAYVAACAAGPDTFTAAAVLAASRHLTLIDVALDAWTWAERTYARRPCRCALIGHDNEHTIPAVERGWGIDICVRPCCRGRQRAFTRRPTV